MAGGGTVKRVPLSTQHIAVLVLTVLLGVTAVAVLVWMAAAGWRDVTGIVVGAIFVVLTLLQALFAVLWWRAQKRTQQQYTVQMEEELIKARSAENTTTEKHSLVTDEVKIAFTDGAQKVDVEMVTIG